MSYESIKSMLPTGILNWLRKTRHWTRRSIRPAAPGNRSLIPVSGNWGWDRGLPVDRYYIEAFLQRHAGDIRGRVLEIGSDSYTRKFGGGNVTQSDVLHVDKENQQATIVADLTAADQIPSDSFDCIVCTETLQLIYDSRAAIRTLHRILKPQGVLLATFPGITHTKDQEWGDHWCWSFTPHSANKLFVEVFPASNVEIESFGNLLAAISFLQGLAAEELTAEELNYRDPGYDVRIVVRARKEAG